MNPTSRRSRIFVAAVAALGFATVGAPSAVAHEGGSKCTGTLAPAGAAGLYEGTCIAPFQGFPIGTAGVYHADDPAKGPSTFDSDIHVEIKLILNNGNTRALPADCFLYDGKDVTRCWNQYNPIASDPTGPVSLTAPEPLPDEIVGLQCNAHSHAFYSPAQKPSGAFACWSTDEAREDLVADYWFRNNGFKADGSGV